MIGLIYGLMAVGLSVIFGIMKIVNFAHGELYMIGAYSTYYLTTIFGLPPPVALPISMAIALVIGVTAERLLLRPLYTERIERKDEYGIIITFGLSIFLQNLALRLFGPETKSPPPFLIRKVEMGLLTMSGDRLIGSVTACIIMVATFVIIKKTWTGRALQATAQDKQGASIVGIDISRMSALSLGLGGALAAAAGALLAREFLVYAHVGLMPAIKGFVIIVLGGMGSIVGSMIGGVLLGLIESLGSVTLSYAYRDAYSFIVLILLLLFRPHGIFGEKERKI